MESTATTRRQGWTKPRGGAKYADQGLKGFHTWFRNGLRHVRLPNGRILTKYEWIDQYLEQFEVKDDVDRIVDEILKD
jgi:hypothetical protein